MYRSPLMILWSTAKNINEKLLQARQKKKTIKSNSHRFKNPYFIDEISSITISTKHATRAVKIPMEKQRFFFNKMLIKKNNQDLPIRINSIHRAKSLRAAECTSLSL